MVKQKSGGAIASPVAAGGPAREGNLRGASPSPERRLRGESHEPARRAYKELAILAAVLPVLA
jgi:hypothetical protein